MSDGILLVDKPAGRSSHDIVALARKALQTRRVGHAGTLDPLATGLLVLGVGEGLKILRYLALDDKRYQARIRLGTETDTLDSAGVALRTAPLPSGLGLQQVRETARAFEGSTVQQVPAISAIKRAGRPLYARVRRGEAVDPPQREVVVHSLEIDAVDAARGEIALRVHCGKGFYVRALARDLARALGCAGHLSALRRTASGSFELAAAADCALLLEAAGGDPAARQALVGALLPLEHALPHVPRLRLDAAGADHARHGRPIPLAHVLGEAPPLDVPELEPLLLSDERGQLLAVARWAQSALRVVRGLALHDAPP